MQSNTNMASMKPAITNKTFTNYINYGTQAVGLTYSNFSSGVSNFEIVVFMTTFAESTCSMTSCSVVTEVDNFWFTVDARVVNTTTYALSVSCNGYTQLASLSFSMVIYDKMDIVNSQLYQLVHDTPTFNMATDNYYPFL